MWLLIVSIFCVVLGEIISRFYSNYHTWNLKITIISARSFSCATQWKAECADSARQSRSAERVLLFVDFSWSIQVCTSQFSEAKWPSVLTSKPTSIPVHIFLSEAYRDIKMLAISLTLFMFKLTASAVFLLLAAAMQPGSISQGPNWNESPGIPAESAWRSLQTLWAYHLQSNPATKLLLAMSTMQQHLVQFLYLSMTVWIPTTECAALLDFHI